MINQLTNSSNILPSKQKNVTHNLSALKQAALETVRCEELQLEMKSAMSAMKSKSTAASRSMSYSNPTTLATSASSRLDHKFSTTSAAATSGLTSIMSHNTSTLAGMTSLSGVLSSTARTEPSTVTWAPTPEQKTSEIDKIMAKIEQARLSIANVCVLI